MCIFFKFQSRTWLVVLLWRLQSIREKYQSCVRSCWECTTQNYEVPWTSNYLWKNKGNLFHSLATLQSHEISCRPVMQTAAQYTEPLAPFRPPVRCARTSPRGSCSGIIFQLSHLQNYSWMISCLNRRNRGNWSRPQFYILMRETNRINPALSRWMQIDCVWYKLFSNSDITYYVKWSYERDLVTLSSIVV